MRFRTVAFVGFLLALSLLTGSILVWRIFALSIVALAVGYLWSYLNIRGISVQTRIPAQKYHAGDWFEAEHTVSNDSWLPKPMVQAQVSTDLPGYEDSAIINLVPRGSYSWHSKVFCARRGFFTIGPLSVTTHEPFGLFAIRRSVGKPQDLLVYPTIVKLPYFGLGAGTQPGAGAGRWALTQMSPSIAFIREYSAGDSLNHIHWHGTAHTGELMVKIFDAELPENASSDVWVVADMYQPAQDEAYAMMQEYCVTIAASLVKKLVDSGKHTGLIACGEQPYFFLPEPEQEHLWQMLETLAMVKENSKVTIEQVLLDEGDKFETGSTVILVTSSQDEKIADALHEIRNRGIATMAVLLDSSSFGVDSKSPALARHFTTIGIPTYVVRKGDNLAVALDNRVSRLRFK
ncbi:MAG: DUF58 domain-containing protein [Chloroflexi bacterium]|nr:DUF58 domain-containing protein [Chloroflexota bacterium]